MIPKRLAFKTGGRDGFTLIELLIVIAIILILIAIALPNFLEAQIRARVARVKGEIRSLGIAMVAYNLDFKAYPSESEADALNRGHFERGLFWLTTPIAYITSMPLDPFGDAATRGTLRYYETGGIERFGGIAECGGRCLETWVIFSNGPDFMEDSGTGPGDVGIDSAQPHCKNPGPQNSITLSYSATNGTKSHGDIFQFGGDSYWIGVCIDSANKAAAQAGNLDRGLNVNHRVYLHQMPPPLE